MPYRRGHRAGAHDKHHQTYVGKANAALEGPSAPSGPSRRYARLSDLPDDKRTAVRNNGGGKPSGALAEARTIWTPGGTP